MIRVQSNRAVARQDFWWGIAAGIASLLAVFVVPAFVGADGTRTAVTAAPTPLPRVTVAMRTQEGVVFSGEYPIPAATTTSLARVLPTRKGAASSSVPVPARSVLALLTTLDAKVQDFAITDISYFTSYNSFFINCIDTPVRLCGSWQYTVNGTYPQVGPDKYLLKPGDSVYFFFGPPRIVTLTATSTAVHAPVTATVREYDPVTGAYRPKSGFTLGITQDTPKHPFTPKEVITAPVRADGTVEFRVATTGVYKIGIQEDFYFPATSFVVATSVRPASMSSVGRVREARSVFSAGAALQFLARTQEQDGSFGSGLLTDWVALALSGGSGVKKAQTALRTYFGADTSALSTLTEYERRAMAMMALDMNPYTSIRTELVPTILGYFDGVQMGDPSLVNDDIFALIPLTHAGFDEDDVVIKKTIQFVVSQQKKDGSWEGGVDLTAAAIQALTPYKRVVGVEESLVRARTYLRNAQKADGGFGDVFATSWALQAIAALGEDAVDWRKDGNTPLTYLAAHQAVDGGIGASDVPHEVRVWATAYAIPGVLGKVWDDILPTFKAPRALTKQIGRDGTLTKVQQPITSKTIIDKKATSTPKNTPVAKKKSVVAKGVPVFATTTSATRGGGATTTLAHTQASVVASQKKNTTSPEVPVVSTTTTASTSVAQAATATVDGMRTTSRTLVGVFGLLLLGFVGLAFMHRKNSSA
jgi:Squalene-hopene cyclase C-terminal domain/Domain of unknown function (DUF4430)/Prenyltransferase and squalene oxidase repeat